MAHKVTFSLPDRELGRADIIVVVKQNGRAFGKLLVSKGGIVWRGKGKSRRGRKLGWGRLVKAVKEYGVNEPN